MHKDLCMSCSIIISSRYVHKNARFGVGKYSVMQSDGNSFGGDVVSDSFNKTFWDENNILYQIYKNQYFRNMIMMISFLYNVILKCNLTLQLQ